MLLLALAATTALWTPAPTPGTPTPTPSGPALSATVGKVRCPQRQVPVSIVNDTDKPHSYTLVQNGKDIRTEQVPADQVLQGAAQLTEDKRTILTVKSGGKTIARATRTANCTKNASPNEPGEPGESGGDGGKGSAGPPTKLPHTGPGTDGSIRLLTAVGGLAGGGVLLFWGMLWPGSGRGDWSTPVRRTGV